MKTRFAPSPTGRLHLGNARTALFNALLARGAGGVFLLRIEDTDPERSRPEYLAGLVEDLRWLGLDWQEGYLADGDAGPYRQSERAATYAGHFHRLEAEGLAYPCFCTAERLRELRRQQLARGEPPRYDGSCAGLSPAQARARIDRGEAPVLRFRVPAGEGVVFEDAVRGPQRFQSDAIGDFVVRRADGTPAFFFSNALDDALMGVTHVLRAEDHLSNTPRQLLLLRALGLPAPHYAHLSLVVDAAGAPLSKRAGSVSLESLRGEGYRPLAVVNYLARLGHHYREEGCLELDGLAAGFDLAALGASPARYESGQLRHWQHLALAAEPFDRLWPWLGEGVHRRVPPGLAASFLEAVRGNVLVPADAEAWAVRIFDEPLGMDAEARAEIDRAGKGFFAAALAALDESPADLGALLAVVRRRTGAVGKALYRPLRAALTGRLEGPELARVFTLLGPERARARLRAAAAAAGGEPPNLTCAEDR
jgi:glutamyl-tRNA synthetase